MKNKTIKFTTIQISCIIGCLVSYYILDISLESVYFALALDIGYLFGQVLGVTKKDREYMERMLVESEPITEKDLEINDIWESVNGNQFIRISEDYSIYIGVPKNREPDTTDLNTTQYLKRNDISPVKKIGILEFLKP